MFVALDTRTGIRSISLDPRHSDDELRDRGRSGVLSCPECRQLVIFRAGSGSKRRHFAHKQLSNCSLEYEPPEMVEARAVLYEWAVSKFPDQVQIEYRPADDASLPRPIDVWITLPAGRHGALWVFDASIKNLETREGIRRYFANSRTAAVMWMFLSTMLTEVPNNPDAILLSKMERDFVVRTRYDEIQPGSDGTLHYLDIKTKQLTTCRRLRRVHEPNVYASDIYTDVLTALLVHSKPLGIAHPGEHEGLMEFRKYQNTKRARRQSAVRWFPPSVMTSSETVAKPRVLVPLTSDLHSIRREPVTVRCRICGELKNESELVEWVRGKGEGTCRPCMRHAR